MGVLAAIIPQLIGLGVKLLGSAGGPSYPSPPQLYKLPVQEAKKFMQQYELGRMNTSIAEWKKRFPLLYQGGNYELNDIKQNQQGHLSPTIKAAIAASGLTAPTEKDQYAQARDLGLSPITLSQRTSEAVNRNIANNPEWTNKISGGTLATMIANNYQNQNTFNQFLGANSTANYVASVQRNAGNTAALISGIGGGIGLAGRAYQNNQLASMYPNPLSLGGYYQGASYDNVTYPSYSYNSPTTYSQPQAPPAEAPMNPYGNETTNIYSPDEYSNMFSSLGYGG